MVYKIVHDARRRFMKMNCRNRMIMTPNITETIYDQIASSITLAKSVTRNLNNQLGQNAKLVAKMLAA